MPCGKSGWKGERYRHGLSSKGIKTVTSDIKHLFTKRPRSIGVQAGKIVDEDGIEFLLIVEPRKNGTWSVMGEPTMKGRNHPNYIKQKEEMGDDWSRDYTNSYFLPESGLPEKIVNNIHKIVDAGMKKWEAHHIDPLVEAPGKEVKYTKGGEYAFGKKKRPKLMYGLFVEDVKFKDRYKVTTPPKIFFKTKAEAEKYVRKHNLGPTKIYPMRRE